MSVIIRSDRDPKAEDEWVELDSDEETISPDLQRLLDQEARLLQPYQEELETVNLGQGQEIQEVNIGTHISDEIRTHVSAMIMIKSFFIASFLAYNKILNHIIFNPV